MFFFEGKEIPDKEKEKERSIPHKEMQQKQENQKKVTFRSLSSPSNFI